jgi:DUF971 family protein
VEPVPVEITRANTWDVSIRWSDGHVAVYPAAYLRRACCCAVCLERPAGDEEVDETLDPDVHPLAIHAVGSYAIHFEWSDGHATGVYPYAYLRGLCPCAECRR